MGLTMIVAVVVAVILAIISATIMFGLVYMAIKGARGDKVAIKDAFYSIKSLKNLIRCLIFVIVFFIIALVNIIPILGQIIFIVLMILLCYSLFIYIMAPSENIVYALKESFAIAKENIVITLVAIIVAIILNFIGSLLIVGTLVTTPVLLIFMVLILKELKPGIKDQSE
jgi:hypothetical protein